MSINPDNQERLDKATRNRLAKLAETPVDTSSIGARLEQMFDDQVNDQPTVLAKIGPFIRSAAAVLIIGVTLAIILLNSNTSPTIASMTEMTRVHQEVSAGTDTIQVVNYDQAHNAITGQWPSAPAIPKPTVGQITACCLHKLERKEVVCVAMEYMDQVVTMAIGHSRDLVCGADHAPLERNGKTYLVHQGEDLQMVMIEHSGRWVCIMSKLDIDNLITLADGLEF